MTEIVVEDQVWTSEWPTEPGKYWFYGYYYGDLTIDGLPKFGLVTVVKTQQDYVIRLVEGKFMYQEDSHLGFFTKAETPVVPPLSAFETLGLKLTLEEMSENDNLQSA